MSNRVLFLIECDATKTKSKVWENWSGWFAVSFSSTSVWSKKGAISSDQSQREVKQNQKVIPDYFQPSIELSFDKLTLATNLLTGVILSLNVIYYISHLLCVLWLVKPLFKPRDKYSKFCTNLVFLVCTMSYGSLFFLSHLWPLI